eukprot:3493068-Prymnesium_polylepis.1
MNITHPAASRRSCGASQELQGLPEVPVWLVLAVQDGNRTGVGVRRPNGLSAWQKKTGIQQYRADRPDTDKHPTEGHPPCVGIAIITANTEVISEEIVPSVCGVVECVANTIPHAKDDCAHRRRGDVDEK